MKGKGSGTVRSGSPGVGSMATFLLPQLIQQYCGCRNAVVSLSNCLGVGGVGWVITGPGGREEKGGSRLVLFLYGVRNV